MCRISIGTCLYADRSAATRTRLTMRADIAYGNGPRETMDLFFPPAGMAATRRG